MNPFIIAALLALAPIAVALRFLFRTLSARQNAEIGVESCLELPLGKYRPMERLLQKEDFQFLEGQPGYSAGLGRRFRTERRRVFRGYLKCLKSDFGRVSLTFQTLIVHAAEDRGDLAAGLVRQRLMFSMAMLAVQGRLLCRAGPLNTATADGSGAVESSPTTQAPQRPPFDPRRTRGGRAFPPGHWFSHKPAGQPRRACCTSANKKTPKYSKKIQLAG